MGCLPSRRCYEPSLQFLLAINRMLLQSLHPLPLQPLKATDFQGEPLGLSTHMPSLHRKWHSFLCTLVLWTPDTARPPAGEKHLQEHAGSRDPGLGWGLGLCRQKAIEIIGIACGREVLYAVPEMAQEFWLETLKLSFPPRHKASRTLCQRFISLNEPFAALACFYLPCI